MIKQILKKSLEITLKNPLLWIFAFLASYITINELVVIIEPVRQIFYNKELSLPFLSLLKTIKISLETKVLVFKNFSVLLFFWIVPFLLAVWAEFVLFTNIQRKLNNQKFSLKIKKSFWWVLLINIILTLINNLILITINQSHQILPPVIFWISTIIICLLELIIFLILKFSLFFIICQQKELTTSLKKSVKFFFSYWKKICLFLLILFVFNLLFGIITNLVAVGGFYPFSVLSFMLKNWGLSGQNIPLYGGLIIVGFFSVIIWSIFFVFQNAA